MGDPTAFVKVKRKNSPYRPVEERKKDYKQVVANRDEAESREQASRCMDCGIPFCHFGCPVNNIIPEWNDLVYKNHWDDALEILHQTNPFPEFTGTLCPAPCESACCAGIGNDPITIREVEWDIAERGFKDGTIKPNENIKRTGRKVAVIGSGPAGLAVAQRLNLKGHEVTVFERANSIGGLLRYGIPDFKMEKWVIDRRLEVLEKEGIIFKTGVNVGTDVTTDELKKDFDAIVLATGSTKPRDLPIPGRDLDGVYFAMQFLTQQNKRVRGEEFEEDDILANDKHVIVIGGGDTGSDCIGTSNRHGAKSITQLEIMPKPPEERDGSMPWPQYNRSLKVTSSHEEGAERMWSVVTKEFIGEEGVLKKIKCAKIEWGPETDDNGRPVMKEVPGSEFELPADLVVLAMGFLHPEHNPLTDGLGVQYDGRGNIEANYDDFETNVPGVYSVGDSRRGQSLIVWAIAEGVRASKSIDKYLKSLKK